MDRRQGLGLYAGPSSDQDGELDFRRTKFRVDSRTFSAVPRLDRSLTSKHFFPVSERCRAAEKVGKAFCWKRSARFNRTHVQKGCSCTSSQLFQHFATITTHLSLSHYATTARELLSRRNSSQCRQRHLSSVHRPPSIFPRSANDQPDPDAASLTGTGRKVAKHLLEPIGQIKGAC